VPADEVVVMAKRLSVQATEIPLYLIPKVIAKLIQLKGEAVYRISVVRTHWHHYNVSIRTKWIRPEPVPVPADTSLPADHPPKHSRKQNRRCGT
jgi:hypothetical protein